MFSRHHYLDQISFFNFSTTEYGADSALLKPFLHTWRLGVEEQFYVAFPIIAIVVHKYFRAYFLSVLTGLALLSLQFADTIGMRNSDLNFYLPFSRFWELATGALLAYFELNHESTHKVISRKVLPVIGLYLLLYRLMGFDGDTPHPSFYTLIPIIGVSLFIGFLSRDDLVGRVLSSSGAVLIGLISYSAYLWHFPILAFSRINAGEPSSLDKPLLLVFTFGVSALSYFIVETPLRSAAVITSRKFLITFIFVFSAWEGFTIRY